MSQLDRTGVQGTVMASDGILLMGLSLIVTILGTQAYYRIRGQPINNAVAGLVIGMCTGALVFSELWWTLFGFVSHRAIQLDSQVFYNILIPPIVFYAGFSVKKKLFFKNLVTIAIFGILGCNLTAGLLSAGIYPILKVLDVQSLQLAYPLPDAPPLRQPLPSLRPPPPPFTRSLLASTEPRFISPTPLPPFTIHPPITQPPPSPQAPPYKPHAAPSASRHTPLDKPTTLLSSALRLGTVFSPTDNLAILHYLSPNTQPVLHSLLFGEGVMNDISAVVMLMTMQDMNTVTASTLAFHYWHFITMFISSSLLGVAAGLLSALLTKHFFDEAHHHTDREVILMTAVAVSAYVCAAAVGCSGTLAVFFCGITMSHYTWHSISASARVMSVHNFRVLCSVSEMFLFIYAGLDVSAKLSTHIVRAHSRGDTLFLRTVVALALALGLLILVVRALFVALAVAIVNLWRSYKFTYREAVTMWYGGLVRGSITTALAYSYLYIPSRSTPGDEAILLSSILVVVVSTVAIGGASEAFMRFVTLPPAQTRLIEITSLPGMAEDEVSMHSAAVLSSKLHKMWRKFDRTVFQRLFGGRDSRMPNYFASVAELNQRILRIQDTSGHLPVSVLPQTNHTLAAREPTLLSSVASTHMSDMLTADFHESECGSHYVPSGSPSPRPSSLGHSHHEMDPMFHRNPHHHSSEIHSQKALSAGSSTPNQALGGGYEGSGPSAELPSTTHLLQQMDAVAAAGSHGHSRAASSAPPDVSLLDGLLFPRSYSDTHVQESPQGANCPGQPSALRRLLHSKTMQEARPHSVRVITVPTDDVSPRPVSQRGPAEDTDASRELSLRGSRSLPPNDLLGDLQSEGGGADHVRRGGADAAASDFETESSSGGSDGYIDMGLVATLPDSERVPRKQGSRDAGLRRAWQPEGRERSEEQDRGDFRHAVAEARPGGGPVLWNSGDRRPPVGPSAAAARRAAHSEAIAVPDGRLSTEAAQEVWSEHTSRNSMGGSPHSLTMANQMSRVVSDAFFASAYSGTAENPPGPFQPPPSNATSEDVHVGAEAPFSSFEDALMDLAHGGEDLEIPWAEYDEADKRAAFGSRSAMN